MSINIIAAVGPNHVIGCDGKIPWRLPNDIRRFRGLTMGHAVLMGRKTWESLKGPLPGRTNIVVTRELAYAVPEGVIVIHNPLDAPLILKPGEHLFVIGGEEVYQACLPSADRLYITEVEGDFKGDAYFPPYEESGWYELESPIRRDMDVNNPYPHRFLVLKRCR